MQYLKFTEFTKLCNIYAQPKRNELLVETLEGDLQRVGDMLLGRGLPLCDKYPEWEYAANWIREFVDILRMKDIE